MNRLQRLQELVENDPTAPFPLYGLAMELKSLGRLKKAADAFALLLDRHPQYRAAYLHYGLVLVELDQPEQAGAVFYRGIEVCHQAGDEHARDELRQAIAEHLGTRR